MKGNTRKIKDDVRSAPKEKDHDQRMREAHFGAIDGTVTRAFKDCENIMVSRVKNNSLDGRLMWTQRQRNDQPAIVNVWICARAQKMLVGSRRNSACPEAD